MAAEEPEVSQEQEQLGKEPPEQHVEEEEEVGDEEDGGQGHRTDDGRSVVSEVWWCRLSRTSEFCLRGDAFASGACVNPAQNAFAAVLVCIRCVAQFRRLIRDFYENYTVITQPFPPRCTRL